MEHRTCSPKDEAAVTALRDRRRSYCGRDSELAQDLRTRDIVSTLRDRLLAYDLKHRARRKSFTVDVLPEEEAKDLRSDVADAERVVPSATIFDQDLESRGFALRRTATGLNLDHLNSVLVPYPRLQQLDPFLAGSRIV
ncbi:hypothetical protein Droror1_Dr00012318 [Drosera rotundifolia]